MVSGDVRVVANPCSGRRSLGAEMYFILALTDEM
jgi:hypothetical protein